MPFVIDNSVVCGRFLASQSSDCTEAIARRLLDAGTVAPGLWPLELGNAAQCLDA